ncbi:serine hydrolase [Sinorhizobium sp. RAC02]|uniref:serine hydrolase domain-containing protein n=1 Tax=Sinorhizobium sp. RAC02 TaxID=1842534 RepID=UPI00083E04A0|nr:serine hydrolase [Sinorhizobium sp. RAC02]AOF92548.1 beta-lactamase family protein [Sinorhizobium sp. RAC02]
MSSSISKTLSVALAVALPVLALPHGASGQDAAPLSAEQSDPRTLGWMQGFPPSADKIIRFSDSDYFSFPKSRWTVCHFRQLMPTTNVSRGLGAPTMLERKIDPAIDGVTFRPTGADQDMTWLQSLSANYTDGIVVLHKGVLVYEHYSGCLTEAGQHGAMSVTKSLTGLLGEVLVAEGALDDKVKVATVVPELAQSAFGDATIRQVLDMTTGLRYSEDYADPNADVWIYSAAGNPLPKPEGYTGPRSYFDYLKTVVKQGEHGPAFGYKTINSDALGWIIARISGKSVADLLSERIWSKIGAEQDAYYTVDSTGTPFAGGGLNAGLRDMARIGQLLLDGGMAGGQRLIPQKAIDSIRAGGDKAAFEKGGYPALKGWSYRAMWWITHNANGAFMARGVHGQAIYIDPTAEMVIARFSSHPVAGNAANDPTSLPAYEAVARHLIEQPTTP